MNHRIIIIGGGISGLTAAHRLTELNRKHQRPLEITVLEAADRFGGLLETRKENGFLLEGGADAFLTERPWAVDLCRRIGLSEEIVPTQREFRGSLIAQKGRLFPLPEGFYLAAPADWRACWNAPGLSWKGKLRLACERWLPRGAPGQDESVAAFFRRRLGPEAWERIGEPMIGGIYTADPEKLSIRAALPKFFEMEQNSGSLARALSKNKEASRAQGPRYGLFVTLRRGMGELIDVLIQDMPQVQCRSSAAVEQVRRFNGTWRVRLKVGEELEADRLCLALPAPAAGRLLRSFSGRIAGILEGIPYNPVVIAQLVYGQEDLPRPLEGFGIVASARETDGMVGCTFSSRKFPGRSPAGRVLIRAFLGGAQAPELVNLPAAEIEQRVRKQLGQLLGIKAAPRHAWIRRHREAMPQYPVGHLDRIRELEQELARFPGLTLTGNGYRGIGIPDCVHQAEAAAEQIFASWTTSS